MKERLLKLKEMIEELKSNNVGDQFGIADFVEKNQQLQVQMNKLCAENSMYERQIKEIDILLASIK